MEDSNKKPISLEKKLCLAKSAGWGAVGALGAFATNYSVNVLDKPEYAVLAGGVALAGIINTFIELYHFKQED